MLAQALSRVAAVLVLQGEGQLLARRRHRKLARRRLMARGSVAWLLDPYDGMLGVEDRSDSWVGSTEMQLVRWLKEEGIHPGSPSALKPTEAFYMGHTLARMQTHAKRKYEEKKAKDRMQEEKARKEKLARKLAREQALVNKARKRANEKLAKKAPDLARQAKLKYPIRRKYVKFRFAQPLGSDGRWRIHSRCQGRGRSLAPNAALDPASSRPMGTTRMGVSCIDSRPTTSSSFGLR